MTDRQDAIGLSRHAQNAIARQNSRTNSFVESIWSYVEQLSQATNRSDWLEVERLARIILLDSLVFGGDDFSAVAEQLNEEIQLQPGSIACQRGVEQLRSMLSGYVAISDGEAPDPQPASDDVVDDGDSLLE